MIVDVATFEVAFERVERIVLKVSAPTYHDAHIIARGFVESGEDSQERSALVSVVKKEAAGWISRSFQQLDNEEA